jgi:hypothetical protein
MWKPPKKYQLTDEKKIGELIQMYNEFVDAWNRMENDPKTPLPSSEDEWSKITTLGGAYRYKVMFNIKSERYTVRHEVPVPRAIA